jgi:cholesterol transport system auxiliary component
MIAAGTLLAGCATKSDLQTLYDLGPAASYESKNSSGSAPLCIAEISAPAWLESPSMTYRLAYADVQQPRPYSGSRWAMPPTQLFGQLLKSRMAQGGPVLSETDCAGNLLLLRIEVDDFTQIFDTPAQSRVQIALRASVFQGRVLLAQKNFLEQDAAQSPDAASGAKALLAASETLTGKMMAWLAALPAKR